MSVMPNSPAHVSPSPAAARKVAADHGRAWASIPLNSRLQSLAKLRAILVSRADELAEASPRAAAEFLSSELIPLVDACRFLERSAAKWLKPRRVGSRGRPGWLRGLRSTVAREPLGAVLIIAPSNYPLFLPGVATLQALAAGNSVVLKPGRGGRGAADTLRELIEEAGISPGLVQVLDETPEAGHLALGCGFDKVLFTGSASTGRRVLSEAARTLTPATVELSGCDLALMLPGFDRQRAADAIAFGLSLNGGCTCIAPRRLFVPRGDFEAFKAALTASLEVRPSTTLDRETAEKLETLAGDAEPIIGGPSADATFAPAIYADLPDNHSLLSADIFAPVAALCPYDTLDEAIALANRCPYRLGASIFGPKDDALAASSRLEVSNVTINDIIVPTADPRLPFPARGESGFGVTRGGEGLLALTRPKVIARRKGRWLPHLDTPAPGDAELLSGYLQLTHGARLRDRLAGLRRLKHAIKNRNT